MEALLLWLVDLVRGVVQGRRYVRVGVHRAYFSNGNPVPHQFIKITNRSPKREIEVTHVWVEGDPRVYVVLPERPLPKRLKPDQQTELWVPVPAVAHVKNVEHAVRVMLTTGKVIKSRLDRRPAMTVGDLHGWQVPLLARQTPIQLARAPSRGRLAQA